MRKTRASIVLGLAGALGWACGGSDGAGVNPDQANPDGGAASDAQGNVTVDSTISGDDSGVDGASIDATLPNDGAHGPLCIPGQSVACVGPGGCASNQVCDIEGTGFFACTCPGDGGSTVCAPGQSVACVGSGGCTTNQVCKGDGTGYGPCVCGGADAGAPELCIPGESVGCVGFGGCVSSQVCKSDGSGYDVCACANDGGKTLACVPGQSIACGGAGGCTGFQLCKSDGSGYAACDCPDAGGAGDASVGWTPAQLPGLAVWLDDTGIVMDPVRSGAVRHWVDRSGNHNDATQSASSGAPYVAADPLALNGHSAVVCSSAAVLKIPADSTLDWSSGECGIVVVEKLTGSAYVEFFSLGGWKAGVFLGTNGTPTSLIFDEGVNEASITFPSTEKFHIVSGRGNALNLAFDSVTATGPTSGNVAAAIGDVTLCFSGSGQVGDVEMAEVIGVKGTLSDADLAKAVSYLKTKFAL